MDRTPGGVTPGEDPNYYAAVARADFEVRDKSPVKDAKQQRLRPPEKVRAEQVWTCEDKEFCMWIHILTGIYVSLNIYQGVASDNCAPSSYSRRQLLLLRWQQLNTTMTTTTRMMGAMVMGAR